MDFKEVQREINKLRENIEAQNVKNEKLKVEIEAKEEQLTSLKTNVERLNEKYKEQEYLASVYKKESTILKEKTNHKSISMSKLSKEIENTMRSIEIVKLQKNKARLILKKEQVCLGIHQENMNELMKKCEAKKNGVNGFGQTMEDKSIQQKSVMERKQFLLTEIERMTVVLKDFDKECASLDTQINTLKKRNAAMKHRLQCKVNEAERDRLKWMEKYKRLIRILRNESPLGLDC